MGSRRGGGRGGCKSRRSPPPWKRIFWGGGLFCYVFHLMGGLFHHVEAFLLLFSPCGGLFAPFFLCGGGGLFCPHGVLFLGLPPCKKFFGRPCVEYDIMFNGDKSKLLLFKGRSSVIMPSEIMVNGQIVGVSEKNSSFRSYCIDDGW